MTNSLLQIKRICHICLIELFSLDVIFLLCQKVTPNFYSFILFSSQNTFFPLLICILAQPLNVANPQKSMSLPLHPTYSTGSGFSIAVHADDSQIPLSS